MKSSRLLRLVWTFPAVLFSAHAISLGVDDYMVITEMAPEDGNAFIMSNSEIGAIGVNGSTSPPGSLPALPGGTERTVTSGISLDGDAAITNSGKVSITLSNSDVHAVNTGDLNPGSQGIDCDSSFNDCTDDGSQISSGNRFNQSSPTESFSTLADNNGVQGGIDLSSVTTEVTLLSGLIDGLGATGTRTLSGGQVNNEANAIWDYSGDLFAGLNIIDITTSGNDFSIENSNLTIKGDAGDTIIFRVESSAVMHVSQSNLLLDGGIGDNNVLWYVDADEGEESFNFDNVIFQGMSLWDIDPDDLKNVVSFNNVQFCGQVVSDQVNFQNTSGSGCTFDTAAVPVPAAAWLFGSALLGLAVVKRKKA